MALANENELVKVGLDNTIISPIGHEYKTATIVDKDTPFVDMLRYIDGAEWRVTYFNQMKAEEDILSNLDIQTSATLQSYAKVSRLLLKVQTAIEVGDDASISGTAIVIGNLVPQVEDLLFVELAGGRPALLRVNEVVRNTYTLSAAFEITYVLDSWVDTAPDRYNDLLTKISKEYYFDDEYAITESSPILLASTYEFKKKITRTLLKLPKTYFHRTMDNQTNFLTMPDNINKVIDIDLSAFFFSLHNVVKTPELLGVNIVTMPEESLPTVYTAMLNKDVIELELSPRFLGKDTLHRTINHTRLGDGSSPILNQIMYTGINNLLGPSKEDISYNPIVSSQHALKYVGVLPTLVGEYLFTENLYNLLDENLSVIEKLLYEFFKNQTMSDEGINKLIDTYRYWSDSEIFFYLPIMIFLLKAKIRNVGDELYRYIK